MRCALVIALALGLATPLRGGQVVIQEIMYRPPGDGPEWVELRNISGSPLDISAWRFSASDAELSFPSFSTESPGAAFLKPFETFVLSSVSPDEFRRSHPGTGDVRVLGPWKGRLKSEDRLLVKDKNGIVAAEVAYRDSGEWPLAADGAGHTLELTHLDADPLDVRSWRASRMRLGTPGRTEATPTLPGGEPRPTPTLSEIHFDGAGRIDWIEVVPGAGDGADGLPSGAVYVASRRDFSDRVLVPGPFQPLSPRVVETRFEVAAGRRTLPIFLVDAATNVLDARAVVPLGTPGSWQRHPVGGREWYQGLPPSRGNLNPPPAPPAVVINEIMYDPPAGMEETEFVELHNRGPSAVDLGGWRLRDAVEFVIPKGTTLPAGGYLAIARDPARLLEVHGAIGALGPMRKKLSNQGDRLRLVDADGNRVAEVEYRAGGEWPVLAKGGGSSLELRHPALDGSIGSAWVDSDESRKTEFQQVRLRGRYQQLFSPGFETDFRELHLHGVGASHLALRRFSLVEVGGTTNLLRNTGTLSTNGSGVNGWLAQGNHARTRVEDGVLHLISDGHGDNRANRVEMDVPGLRADREYELTFEARWISGIPRLIVQTWDHSFAGSIAIPIPRNLGTPGRPNSREIASAPPALTQLQHSPAVPHGDRPVRIQVKAIDPSARLVVWHRPDSLETDTPWTSALMEPQPVQPGADPGRIVYTADLEYREQGQVVQFFVEATGPGGERAQLPREGAGRPALFVVDNRPVPVDLRTTRFVISALDLDSIAQGGTARHGHRYPKLANHYLNATFISEEREIRYGTQIRRSGSAWNRGDTLSRGKWKPPGDQPYRGQRKFVFDDDTVGARRYSDRFVNYLLYLVGHPSSESEFIRVIVNNGPLLLREEVEPVDSGFLRRHFPKGTDGSLYRIDDEWWFDDDWNPYNRDADWSYKGTSEPARYRTEWMKRTNEEADDFDDLIGFFKTVGKPGYTREEIESLIDPHAVMKMAAVSGYVANWDTFTMYRGKNGYFYRRPTDGRFQFLHWDSDAAFDSGWELDFYGPREPFRGWVEKPQNLRLLLGYLHEIIDQHTGTSPRMAAWMQAQHTANPATPMNIARLVDWFERRGGVARERYGRYFSTPFTLTRVTSGTPGEKPTLQLRGTAPVQVIQLRVDGLPHLEPEWISPVDWVFQAVPRNATRLIGSNAEGRVVLEAEIPPPASP